MTTAVSFVPNVLNSWGYLRFTVAKGSGINYYGSEKTKFVVTFGDFAFDAGNRC
jgi:hypothetical protein